MGEIGAVVVYGVAILIIVEIFVIGHAAVQTRKELQRLRRLFLISLSFQHADFSIVGRGVFPQSLADGAEFPLLNLFDCEWTCIAKGAIEPSKPARIVGFRGDQLLVSSTKP